MPYIKPEDRRRFQEGVFAVPPTKTEGELNYVFTLLAIDHLKEHGLSYATINEIDGAFDAARMEFYRRVAAPYEDMKIAENGDVYPTLDYLKAIKKP